MKFSEILEKEKGLNESSFDIDINEINGKHFKSLVITSGDNYSFSSQLDTKYGIIKVNKDFVSLDSIDGSQVETKVFLKQIKDVSQQRHVVQIFLANKIHITVVLID
jgi:hypothetical protein